MRRIALRLMIGALVLAVSGLATPIVITNPGFDENPASKPAPVFYYPIGYAAGPYADCGVGCIAPWTLASGNVDWIPNSLWQAHNGTWSIDLNGDAAGALTINLGNQAAGTYDLSFWMSRNPATQTDVQMQVQAGALAPWDFTFSGVNSLGSMNYQLKTQDFVWGGGAMSITFSSLVATGGWGPVLDDVSLSLRDAEGVPEPGTLWTLLSGAGLLGVAFVLRRKH
jgi:hypothetical protein